MSHRFADGIAAVMARVASLLGPRAMRIIAKVNKRVTNPVQRLWAHRLPYMAVIEHVGRKSGNSYRTPVMAFVEGSELSVVLNYGAKSDWVSNVQAAGSAGVVHRGRRYRLTDPRVVPIDPPELHGILVS
ncbi:MAG TPA: nitroreductase family deazaflavin-dependent oxidoreductase [Mycobacterium sp.]|nr:nitroreductase family deazaflavin-dependent oxidoreductase [Mycobacterium sp.]